MIKKLLLGLMMSLMITPAFASNINSDINLNTQKYPWYITVHNKKVYNPSALTYDVKVKELKDARGRVLARYNNKYLDSGKITFKFNDPYLGNQGKPGEFLNRYEASKGISDILEQTAEYLSDHGYSRPGNLASVSVKLSSSKATVKVYTYGKWRRVPIVKTHNINVFLRHLTHAGHGTRPWERMLEQALQSRNFDISLGHAYNHTTNTPTVNTDSHKPTHGHCVPFEYRHSDASNYPPDDQCGPDGGELK